MGHKHSVYDSDTHFSINAVTRQIKNESSRKTTLIQGDHNSERFSFDLPRFIEGHDMMQCNQVQVHYINMLDEKTQNKGLYEVTDLQISPDDQVVVCSWLISQNATQLVGSLSFLIRFCCVEDGEVTYAWNTAICQSISVSSGISNTKEVTEPFPDILAQWKADLFGVSEAEQKNILTVSAEQQATIVATGEAVKASLPADYTGMTEDVRNKAPAIIVNAEGESIVLNDASDCYLQGLKLFGKSMQNGAPTPDAPVEIVSIENPTVTIGEQTINFSRTISGIPVTSGGNYTDPDGQQWICDEVDLGRGVYVKRVGMSIFHGDESWYKYLDGDGGTARFKTDVIANDIERVVSASSVGRVLCSGFKVIRANDTYTKREGISVEVNGGMTVYSTQYSGDLDGWNTHLSENPITLIYVLANPIETPLSDVEIAAFKALHSNNPNTTILNDAGAYMAVEYVADTKTYIDNLLKGSERS